ncbi:MAG: hypothetical protein HKL80_09205 [Acidimicrobiales bacterium]|nr:hypothetical protein [Acidimicrobiales bacterium]
MSDSTAITLDHVDLVRQAELGGTVVGDNTVLLSETGLEIKSSMEGQSFSLGWHSVQGFVAKSPTTLSDGSPGWEMAFTAGSEQLRILVKNTQYGSDWVASINAHVAHWDPSQVQAPVYSPASYPSPASATPAYGPASPYASPYGTTASYGGATIYGGTNIYSPQSSSKSSRKLMVVLLIVVLVAFVFGGGVLGYSLIGASSSLTGPPSTASIQQVGNAVNLTASDMPSGFSAISAGCTSSNCSSGNNSGAGNSGVAAMSKALTAFENCLGITGPATNMTKSLLTNDPTNTAVSPIFGYTKTPATANPAFGKLAKSVTEINSTIILESSADVISPFMNALGNVGSANCVGEYYNSEFLFGLGTPANGISESLQDSEVLTLPSHTGEVVHGFVANIALTITGASSGLPQGQILIPYTAVFIQAGRIMVNLSAFSTNLAPFDPSMISNLTSSLESRSYTQASS